MNSGGNQQSIKRREAEVKPNLYASYVVLAVVAVFAVLFALCETGIYSADKTIVRYALALAVVLYVIMLLTVGSRRRIGISTVKYVIMLFVLVMTLELFVILNARVALILLLPMLLATQYRSYGLSWTALLGTLFCCFAGPILAFYMNTWDSAYLTSYISTVCGAEISLTAAESVNFMDSIVHIILYISLPYALISTGFGIILFGVTRNGRQGLKNQLRVAGLSDDLNKQLQHQLELQERILCSMSDVIESRDGSTGGHVRRTSEVVRFLVEEMEQDPDSGVDAEFGALIAKTAPMHDLGKIAIDDSILKKPGYLTSEERAIIQTHPQKSAEMIDRILSGVEEENLLKVAHNIALYHHERVDGKGYPEHLVGEQIPLEARIMAVADVYDALISPRYYKNSMSPDDVWNMIINGMGTQFDARLAPYLNACRSKIEQFYRQQA